MQLSLIYGGGADVLQLHPQFRATREWQKKKMLSVKGAGGVPPISVIYFLDQKQVFLGKKTPFTALFEEHFRGNVRKGGEGGTPQIRNLFFGENFVRKGGGVPPLRTKSAK